MGGAAHQQGKLLLLLFVVLTHPSWLACPCTLCAVPQALQYVQENPDEVCPAGWKPGEPRCAWDAWVHLI